MDDEKRLELKFNLFLFTTHDNTHYKRNDTLAGTNFYSWLKEKFKNQKN